jgi:predicted outer membrane repeat protein
MLIYDCESIYVNNCVFKDNYAYYEGGAISSSDIYPDHSMYLTNCCFVSNSTNTTDGGGGAICMAWDDDTQIVNCVFTGNEAHNGGAVQGAKNVLTRPPNESGG